MGIDGDAADLIARTEVDGTVITPKGDEVTGRIELLDAVGSVCAATDGGDFGGGGAGGVRPERSTLNGGF